MLEGGRRFNRSLDRQKIFGNKPVALDRYHPKETNPPIPRHTHPPPLCNKTLEVQTYPPSLEDFTHFCRGRGVAQIALALRS